MESILVVDDDPSLLRALASELTAAGWSVSQATSADEALTICVKERFEVVLTDLSMPRGDGFKLIERIRRESDVPIIVLSVRDGESDKIRALDLGADDYVTKPFLLGELLARVRAQLRRSTIKVGNVYRFQDLTIDIDRRVVTQRGREVHLTPTEFSILYLLAKRSGVPVTTNEIIRQVWRGAPGTSVDAVRVHVSSLRKKIEPDSAEPMYIVTEPWVGYRFIAEPLKENI